ncbi:MAG: hypothetical protein ACRD8W_04315 [Nitrososphaeraceae archaeon]
MKLISNSLFYAAAVATAVAGILHLIFASNVVGSNIPSGTFFIVAGIAQIFWVLPMVRRWGKYGTIKELQGLWY